MTLIVFVLVPIVFMTLPLYSIIDVAQRSSDAFRAADSNKTLWVVLRMVFGILAAIVYLAAIRPKLKVLH